MPLLCKKDCYSAGDAVVYVDSGYVDETRLTPYDRDFQDVFFLQVGVGTYYKKWGSICFLVRKKFSFYYNPNFYTGIGFASDPRMGSYMVAKTAIMGAISGTVNIEDPNEMESCLRKVVKRYRAYLSSRFLDEVYEGHVKRKALKDL